MENVGLLNDFERLDLNNNIDYQFDHIINLDVANDINTNLRIVINELKSIIGIDIPRNNVVRSVLEEIQYYKPISSKKRTAQYYGIALDFNVQNFLTNYYKEHPYEDSETFNILVQMKRIASTHHVTLIHRAQLKNHENLWEKCEKLCKCPARVYINKIVFNSQIMALVVNKIDPSTVYSMNKVAHVTVGTVHKSVKPFQSNKICESALFGTHGEDNIRVINFDQELIIEGFVKAY